LGKTDKQWTEPRKVRIVRRSLAATRNNKALTRAVQAEHERRIRNGTAAQEAAAKEFANAPTILGNILRDNQASPKHRIEAAR
jgi:hypothetical protein